MGQQVLPTLAAEVRLETGGLTKDAAAIIAQQDRIASSGVAAAEKVDAAMKRASDPAAMVAGSKRAAAALEQAGAAGAAAMTRIANAVREAAKANVPLSQIADAAGVAYAKAGEVTTVAQRAVERQTNRVQGEVERLSKSFGLNSDEALALRVQTQALAAAEAGLEDNAHRLLATYTQLTAKRQEAAQLREAEAARERAAAEAAVNAQLMERSRLQAALERNTGVGRAPATDAGATYSALAAKFAEDEARAQKLVAAATRQAADEHARLAALVRGSHDAQLADAAAAERLREATDAEYAATKRLNAQIAESTRLYHSGVTAPAEYARQQQVLSGRLREAGQAHDVSAISAKRNKNSLTQLSFQLNDVVTMAAMGAKPMQIFASQAGQILQVAQTAEGGVKGFAVQVGALAMKLAPAAVVAAGAAIALYRWNQELDKDAGLKKYAEGLGLTHKEMKKLGDQSITTGDMVAGLWKTVSDGMGMGGSGKKLIDWLVAPGDVKMVENFVAQIYGVFAGGYSTIVELWHGVSGSISGSVGGAAQAAAGFFKPVVAGAQWVWQAVSGLFAGLYDKVAGWVRSVGGWVAPIMKAVGLTDAAAAIGAAGAKAGQAFGKNYTASVKQAIGGMDRAAASVGANTIQHALDRVKKQADAIKESRTDKKPKTDHHAEQLARDAEAIEAQIRNLYKLADAYGVSGAAALIAEAREKAESKAIKGRADIDEAVDRQIRLSIAQRVTDAARGTAAMNEQAGAQERVNAQVAAGLIPASQAAQVLQDQLGLQPLLAAQEAARLTSDAVGHAKATAGLAAMTAGQERLNKAKAEAQYNSGMEAGSDQLAQLREELRLIGATDEARVRALATLKATQEANRMIAANLDPTKAADYVQQQVAIADAQQQLRAGQDAYNASLTQTADHWDIIAGKVQSAGQGMADAFGSAGQAIGDVASIYAGYMASQARLETEHKARVHDAGADRVKLAQEAQRYALQSSGTQIAAYGDMLGAAKGFFKEGTAGYEALAAAEKVYRIAQFAMSVQAMVQQVRETVTHVASSAAQASANATVGVSAQAKLPFPFNIAAMAATAAALVAAGISVIGGGGGAASSIDKGNTGTGTVLGDSTKGSDSIKNSIDALSKVDQLTNAYSREMAATLKSIDSQIGSVAAVLVRSGNISADSGVAQGFKANAIGSALGAIPLVGGILKGLFGSTTTVTGSGLTQGGRSVGDILDNGFAANTYSDVEKKSKLFGITTGRSSSTVIGGSADASVNQQFGLILKSFDAAIVAAAGPLGESTQAIADKVKFFVFDLGKVDLKGLTGDEIQEKLSNIFGAAADGMAAAAFPGIERFQKVGEGAFETLTRVASTVEAVTTALDQLGTSSAALGIDAKMGIAAQFDSLSDMSSAVGAYFQAYYSSEEKAAAKTAQMGKMFDSLGLSMPASLAGFRQLVEAQDLTTAAGQSTYATLLQLAPAFADLQTSMDGAKSAADILSERMDLQKQLWQALGDTASIRAAELAQLDPSNRALQQRLYDLADEAAATEAANRVAQERAGLQSALNQLLGDTAAMRAEELAALDPANRALKLQIYALQDQQAAAAAAAQAEQEAAQAAASVAQERRGIEQQLLQLQGDTVALRQRELAALDPTNRALQDQVYALTDLQAAQAAAAQAEQEAAQVAAAIAQERSGLESQLLQLQGDTAALRARELAALDPSNRAIQEMIYALTDLQAAAQAAAAVAQERAGIMSQLWQLEGNTAAIRAAELAGLDASNRALMEQVYALQDQQAATQAASQAAQEAAQAEQAIAQERAGLMQQLWQLTGDTASIRAAALAALDPSNRALQEQIYAVQDAQEAAKAAADLSSAWKSIGDTITDEVNRIRGLTEAQTATGGFAALQGQFNAAVAAARAGDQAAAKGLPDLSKSLLDVAATSATSSQELARVQAETAAMLESVTSRIANATYASDAMTNPVLGSAGGDPGSSSWWARFAGGADAPARIAANDGGDGGGASSGDIDELKDEMAKLRADLTDALAQLAGYARTTANALTRSLGQGGGDGLAVVVQAAA